MNLQDILQSLCLSAAPSGYEKEAASTYAQFIKPYVDRVTVDRMGNVIASIDGTDPQAPAIMVFAHLDTLGFIVRRIEPNGFIQIDRLGGIPEKVLPGLRLSIRARNGKFISGVIGNKAHHASSPEDKYRVDQVTSLFVDVGASSLEKVQEMGIDVGCPAIYEPHFQLLAEDCVSGTALDNRGGVTAMIRAASLLAEKRPASTIHFVGTVWEEFNIRGAVFAARALQPQIAFCLDVVLAGDVPELAGRYSNQVGQGPTVNLYSFHGRGTLNGTLPHEGLLKLAERCAEDNRLPHQRFASLGIITDSAYVQMEGLGIACLDFGFPARYTHTPVEVCSLRDIDVLGQWIAAVTQSIDASFDLWRYRIEEG